MSTLLEGGGLWFGAGGGGAVLWFEVLPAGITAGLILFRSVTESEGEAPLSSRAQMSKIKNEKKEEVKVGKSRTG